MPTVTRYQLSSFYGAVEAGEYLYEPRRSEIIFNVAERYLKLTERIMISQFLSMTYSIWELGPNRLKPLRDRMSSPSFNAIMRYVAHLGKGLRSRCPRKLCTNDVVVAYNDLWILYKKSEAFIDEPGAVLTELIAKGFSSLRKALRQRDIGSIVSAVDFINSLAHSEGTLIMWIDEDCEDSKRFATYTLTLLSASVYQPESLQYMYRDVRKALREKARMFSHICDLYDRKAFLRNFKERLKLLEEFTADEVLQEIDSPTLLKELKRAK